MHMQSEWQEALGWTAAYPSALGCRFSMHNVLIARRASLDLICAVMQ